MSVLATRLKELREKRKDACDKSNALVSKAAAEKRGLNTEEDSQFKTLHAEDMTLRGQCDVIEQQLDAERALVDGELRKRNGGRENINTQEDRDSQWGEYRALKPEQRKRKQANTTRKWILGPEHGGGLDAEDRSYMDFCKAEMALSDEHLRALSTQIGGGGAYTIPQDFQKQLDVALKTYGGMLEVADTQDTSDGALLPWPSINDTAQTGEDLAENAAAGGTTDTTMDPTYGIINLSAYLRDSGIVLLPLTLLQDSAFDPEAYMVPMLQIRLGRRLNNQFTVGLGVQGPTGIDTTVFASSNKITTASATAFTYAEMLKTKHLVDPLYRQKARWMFHDTALLAIKLMVDGNGRPLFLAGGVTAGINVAVPDTIDGDPLTINQDMATLTAGVPAASQHTLLYGDFSKYKIRRVRGLQMVRFGERYMEKLQIGLMVWTRVDGKLLDAGTHPVAGLLQHA